MAVLAQHLGKPPEVKDCILYFLAITLLNFVVHEDKLFDFVYSVLALKYQYCVVYSILALDL